MSANTRNVDVVIVGGGPAGLAAALKCREEGVKDIVVLERDSALGGILQQCIHNGFGLHYFGQELTGPEYAQRFVDMVEEAGIECLTNTMVLEITRDKVVYAISKDQGIVQYRAKAVVLAMGCRERTRGALGIPGVRPSGVNTAGYAQRLVNMEGAMPGKSVVVLGSGDIGLIMARRMKWEGADVKMVVELMPYSSGLTRNIVQCLEDNNIPLKFSHTVVEIHGGRRLTGVTIAQVDENRKPIAGTEEYVECDTLLLSVGLIPENELSDGIGVVMDPVTSGAIVNEQRETEIPGVFACGNVLHVHDLVDHVSEESGIAGRAAARYVLGQAQSGRGVAVKPGEGVRYVVPQCLSEQSEGEKVSLYFRVGGVSRGATAEVVAEDGTVLARRKKVIFTPGEMENLAITPRGNTGSLTVRIVEGKGA